MRTDVLIRSIEELPSDVKLSFPYIGQDADLRFYLFANRTISLMWNISKWMSKYEMRICQNHVKLYIPVF